ncbi:MAG: hypothetical protein IKI06_00740 [Prevotella sp.]|nr:hypothetical protein [Prevotella sp.]
MKHLLTSVILLLLLCACSSPTAEEMASLAAKGYYEHLISGEYEYFLAGKAGADSFPKSYREQLVIGYKQFMAQQEKMHHGIHEIRIVSAKADTLLQCMNVFLVFCYGDSTNEQVAVPMVEYHGAWRMK